MKINTTKVAFLASAALALSLLTPALANAGDSKEREREGSSSEYRAVYPPIFKEIQFNNSTIIIGKPKVTVTNVVTLEGSSSSTSIATNAPLRLIINGVRSGAVVKANLRTPSRKEMELPSFAASRSGVVDVNALAIKIAGVYTLTFKLPNETRKSITITVTG